MAEVTLGDMVQNGTMSAEIAATLATAAAERRSLMMIAIPRMAGKTTTMEAALAHAPEGTAFHKLDAALGPRLGIPEVADRGYLQMAEIAQTDFSHYLWGEPVRQVFSALERGFSLATALHAPGIDEAFSVICEGNDVPDEHAGRIDLAVYIRSLGDDWRNPERRAIAEVREIDSVAGGSPQGRTLFLWNEESDRFEALERPRIIGSEVGGLEERAAAFARGADGT
jgi:hypothetical protein